MLIKNVKYDGSGDYTDITTAFNDMLISGVAATGLISDYLMLVDGGTYSGTLSGFIPYSGKFNIIGSGTLFNLTSSISNISGTYQSYFASNLYIENFIFNCSGINNYSFQIPSGFGLALKNSQFINTFSGIYNSGVVVLDNVSSCGISGSDIFIYSPNGFEQIINSDISRYHTAINSYNINIKNSNIHHNNSGIYCNNLFDIYLYKSLLYSNICDIRIGSGNCYIDNSTISGNIYTSGTSIYVNSSIINGINNISGIVTSGSTLYNSNLYNSNLNTLLTVSGNKYGDPKFNNISIGDYRLKFKQTEGSQAIEIKSNSNYSDSINFIVDHSKLQIYDSNGIFTNNEFLPYIYTQDSSIIFSDYNREIKFSELKNLYKKLYYKLYINLQFEEYNILTDSTFNLNQNEYDKHPWDWDYNEIQTTQIIDNNMYIIPRSFIDIENIILNKIPILPTNISFSNIIKDNIKCYIVPDLRGVSYDYSLSSPGNTIVWMIDGLNQSLIKKDAYSDEYLENYPLLCYNPTKSIIRPSGLIYTGVDGDYYTFIKYDNPNFKLKGLSELGDFQWIATDINQNFDIRGIKVYKNNLFITAGKYPINITNRLIIPSGEPVGQLLWYNNNDLFFNYIKSIDNINNTTLASGNYYPTDLTFYEDGTLMIADYYNQSGLYKYNLAYDYCMINSTYDNETKVILREYYDNVEI
ncbi:MAG: hypothetical protein M0R17_02410 [Candidatus Omnitrophica bacterium]|jgi:hypothetical protein|nr:hypothetical protein [Candidatus Omnitrophota bacterium]